MTRSNLPPAFRRHWPPTSGVLATFFAAKGGSLAPSQLIGPTMVSMLVAAIAAAIGLGIPGSSDALHDIGRDLEQRMDEADRLRPLPLGRS